MQSVLVLPIIVPPVAEAAGDALPESGVADGDFLASFAGEVSRLSDPSGKAGDAVPAGMVAIPAWITPPMPVDRSAATGFAGGKAAGPTGASDPAWTTLLARGETLPLLTDVPAGTASVTPALADDGVKEFGPEQDVAARSGASAADQMGNATGLKSGPDAEPWGSGVTLSAAVMVPELPGAVPHGSARDIKEHDLVPDDPVGTSAIASLTTDIADLPGQNSGSAVPREAVSGFGQQADTGRLGQTTDTPGAPKDLKSPIIDMPTAARGLPPSQPVSGLVSGAATALEADGAVPNPGQAPGRAATLGLSHMPSVPATWPGPSPLTVAERALQLSAPTTPVETAAPSAAHEEPSGPSQAAEADRATSESLDHRLASPIAGFWERLFTGLVGDSSGDPGQVDATAARIGSNSAIDGPLSGEWPLPRVPSPTAEPPRPSAAGLVDFAMQFAQTAQVLAQSDEDDPPDGTALVLGSPLATAPTLTGATLAGTHPLPVPHVAAQITAALSQRADGTTELALSPEELGHVRLRLERDAKHPDRMVVMITFERPETLDLFRRHAGELAEALRSAGFAGADIGFGQQGSGAQGFGAAPGTNGPDPEAGQMTPGLTETPARDTQTPRLLPGASLDLRM